MDLIRKLKLLLPNFRVEKSKTLSILQVLVAALFIVGAALMCYVFIRNEWTSAVHHVIATGESLSGVLATGTEDLVRSGETAALQRAVSRLNKDKQVAFVRVADADGRIIACGGQKTLAAELGRGEPLDSWEAPGTRYSKHKSQQTGHAYYVVQKQIISGDEQIGQVEVALLHPSLSRFLAAGMYRGEIALFGVALLLMVGNYFIHMLIGPIVRLKHKVLEAGETQWDKLELDIPSRGEAGEIAAGIGSILSKLGKENRTLADSNRELQVSNRVMLFEKRRTESVIDGLSEGVIATDSYGRISLINREAEALLEVSRQEVLGRPPAEALAARAEVSRFMTGEQPGAAGRRSAEFDFCDGEGKKIVRVQLTPMSARSERDGQRKDAGCLTMLRDVTQEKMEEQARRDFISNVAHELRAPLSAIKSYVEMLIDNEADTPELRAEFFNTINEEADRLARLIDNMLNISKIEIGGLVLSKSSVKTRKLLEDALASVFATAKSKKIDISADLPDDMPDAEVDKELIRVVVMNLLGNAIKYTDPGGSVMLAGEVDAQELRVHVIDSGWGIPQEEHEKVFDKFFRGKQTDKEKVTGNGLGLALAKEIACLHGGDLRLESQEGKGSKFTLLLPLK